MTKKNLKVTACYYEISHNLEKSLDALEKLDFIKKNEFTNYTTESDAYNWIEGNPSAKQINEFLKEMGY